MKANRIPSASEIKANLRNLLYGEEESGPRKRPKSRGSDASYGVSRF